MSHAILTKISYKEWLFTGELTEAFLRRAMIPGISCSAISISRLPYDA